MYKLLTLVLGLFVIVSCDAITQEIKMHNTDQTSVPVFAANNEIPAPAPAGNGYEIVNSLQRLKAMSSHYNGKKVEIVLEFDSITTSEDGENYCIFFDDDVNVLFVYYPPNMGETIASLKSGNNYRLRGIVSPDKDVGEMDMALHQIVW